MIKTKSTATKKRRGVFYTPSAVSDLIADWAIRLPSDRALEPSFGGCTFLSALQRRFLALGTPEPWGQMFGCDVASAAFRTHLARIIPSTTYNENFVKADFLTLTPASFGPQLFQAALGNPPYVSYHNMFKVQRSAAAKVGFDNDFRVPLTANLWSHFVFHSVRFLAPNGRMAWLLPSSVLQAEYGRAVLNELRRRFARVAVISLQEKLFDGTSERTEILLCDRLASDPEAQIEIANARNLEACSELLRDWGESPSGFTYLTERGVLSLVPQRRLAAFRRIARSSQTVKLKEVAHLSIGMVTGANELFVVSKRASRQHRIPEHALRPIFAKLEITPGLSVRKSDFRSAEVKELRCLLVDFSADKTMPELKSYFSKVPLKLREDNVTFGKRIDWRIPDAGRVPDAFLSYMCHTGPRIILNGCKTNSTNTIHRIYFHGKIPLSRRRLIAISMLSTFSQLSAEIEGRSYGSGVLKHELREAGRIQLLLPDEVPVERITKVFRRIDVLLHARKRAEAQQSADHFLLSMLPGLLSETSLNQLKNDLSYLRRRRRQNKRNETSRAN